MNNVNSNDTQDDPQVALGGPTAATDELTNELSSKLDAAKVQEVKDYLTSKETESIDDIKRLRESELESLLAGIFPEPRRARVCEVLSPYIQGIQSCRQVGSVWLRDLTQEFVEPNPGPLMWLDACAWIFHHKAGEDAGWGQKFKKLGEQLHVAYNHLDLIGVYTVELVDSYLSDANHQEVVRQLFSDAQLKLVKGWIQDFINAKAQQQNPPGAGQALTQTLPAGKQVAQPRLSQKLWQVEGVTPGISFCCTCIRSQQTLVSHVSSLTWEHGGLILVQAPPATGKTAFITLFRTFCDFNVVSVSMLSVNKELQIEDGSTKGKAFEAFLRSKLIFNESRLKTALDPSLGLWAILDNPDIWKQPGPVILLIDEAQMIIGQDFAADFFQDLKARQADLCTTLKATAFFSIFNVETAEEAIKATGAKPSASKGNWTLRLFHSNLLRWTKEDSREFFEDFNKNNGLTITIPEDIWLQIYQKCDGHAGYITKVTHGIHEYCKAECVVDFDGSQWFEYLRRSFLSDVMVLRSSNFIRDLFVSKKLEGASELCQQMLLRPALQADPSDINIRLLTRLGLVAMVKDNFYAFSSQVIRMLVLRYLVSSSIASPKSLLFKDPLSLLLFCLPLLKQRAVEKCLSKTKEGGVDCQKEDFWVNQLFVAAYSVLPSNCFIDPQYTSRPEALEEGPRKKKVKTEEGKFKKEKTEKKEKAKKEHNHGEVDIIVHNGVHYFLEFLITESSPKNVLGYTATIEKDILEHLGRFSPTGKYRGILDFPSAVINVTHHDPPPPVTIPSDHTVAQLYHFVVDEKFQTPKLMWQDKHGEHCVKFKVGIPVSYDLVKKEVFELPFGEFAHLQD